MNYPHPLIAREGWPFIGATLLAALAATYFVGGYVLPGLCWLVLAFEIQFFRDPPRAVPSEPDAVLSPADGRIVRIEKVRDPYAERDALLISVFMNVFNVHSNRASVDGVVRKVQYLRAASSTRTWTRPRWKTSAMPWSSTPRDAR